MHIHICIYTYAYAYTYAYTYTYAMHTHTHTCIHAMHMHVPWQSTFDVPVQRDDAACFRTLRASLETADIPRYDQDHMFACLAACLHLGSLHFVEGQGAGRAAEEGKGDSRQGEGGATLEPAAESEASFEHAASLLGCARDQLRFGLCYRQLKSGRINSEWIVTPNTAEQGGMLAASLAKHIYVKLFDWITEQLNRWMSADVVCAEGEDKKTTLEKAPLLLYLLYLLWRRLRSYYTHYTYYTDSTDSFYFSCCRALLTITTLE